MTTSYKNTVKHPPQKEFSKVKVIIRDLTLTSNMAKL